MQTHQDIIFEIFSRLPIKSLIRFKCVSEFCNHLVSEPDFVDLHSCRSDKNNPGDTKLIARVQDAFYTVEQDHDEDGKASIHEITNFKKLYDRINGRMPLTGFKSCANGLYCIWDVNYVAVYNPTTGEVSFLPHLKEFANLPDYGYIYSIGFEPNEKKYKVVLMINNYEQHMSRTWVFTLGIDRLWREIRDDKGYLFHQYISGICIKGVIYRFSYGPEKFSIAAFDVKSETFTSIPMSIDIMNVLRPEFYDYMLMEVKEKLAILKFPEWYDRDISLWVLGETRNEDCWGRTHVIPFPLEWEDVIFCLCPEWTCKYGDEEIILAVYTEENVFYCLCYDIMKESQRTFKVQGFPENHGGTHLYGQGLDGFFTYGESLFSLKNIGTTHPEAELASER